MYFNYKTKTSLIFATSVISGLGIIHSIALIDRVYIRLIHKLDLQFRYKINVKAMKE